LALTETQIDQAVSRYERELDRYEKLAELIYQRCQEILARTDVRATVQRRAKLPSSLRKKLVAISGDETKAAHYGSVDDVFSKMSDLAGVRIATYVESDRARIVKEIEQEFAGPAGDSPDVDAKDGKSKSPNYRATHCQVRIPDDELPEGAWNLRGTCCEVQVCSLLAHVWNEVEHDLHYKPLSGELGPSETELLDQLAELTRAGDISIKQLLIATNQRMIERIGKFVDVHDFVARMRKTFPSATNFGDNARQLFDELARVGTDSPDAIKTNLLPVPANDIETTALQLLSKLDAHLVQHDERISLDKESSDLLLMLLLDKHADAIVEAHPSGRGKGRPSRLVHIARRFQEMKAVNRPRDEIGQETASGGAL
jgi:ppGpp synthetase/RelA/SpoT-type nucleotidyltranferase